MSSDLLIWRDGTVHGVVAQHRGRLGLSYEAGARPISVSMPVRARPYDDRHARIWLRGLLAEGPIRAMIAYDLGLNAADDFGLLTTLGKDCAGALSLRPEGAQHDEEQVGPTLSEEQIAMLLRSLPTSPLGVDAGFRVSLPGNQSKLLLTRVGSGWHRPDGAPSTHILKPAMRDLDGNTVDNEAYCQHLAAAAGLPAATTTIERFSGVRVLVSTRFDRVQDGPRTKRVHQEDGCQATIVDPVRKYQTADGGPTLRTIAAALAGNGGQLPPLLRLVTFTVVIGNADMHGKNVSFTFNDDDSVSLAPVYDAMSTRLYETTDDGRLVDQALGMRVAGQIHIDVVTVDHLVEEGRTWGLTERLARVTVKETAEAIRSALDHVDAPIEKLHALVSGRLDQFASSPLTPRSGEAAVRTSS